MNLYFRDNLVRTFSEKKIVSISKLEVDSKQTSVIVLKHIRCPDAWRHKEKGFNIEGEVNKLSGLFSGSC
jgi:hypothetical protein